MTLVIVTFTTLEGFDIIIQLLVSPVLRHVNAYS